MKFNLEDYETVKSRKLRFYKDYPDGRIVVQNLSTEPLEYALFMASIFKNVKDQKENCPFSTGTALEIRDKELSVARSGASYESVNFLSWTENCEESAVGRALDNAGYSGNKKPSREEMQKAKDFVDRQKKKPAEETHPEKQLAEPGKTIIVDKKPSPEYVIFRKQMVNIYTSLGEKHFFLRLGKLGYEHVEDLKTASSDDMDKVLKGMLEGEQNETNDR